MTSQLPHLPTQRAGSFFKDIFVKIRKALTAKSKVTLLELPEFLRVFGLLLANGLPVGVAISWLGPKLQGSLGHSLTRLSRNLELGADLVAELRKLDADFQNPAVTEFCQKLIASIERGAPVSNQIAQLARTVSQEVARDLIKRAGSNETKMLIPTIFLILPVTVLFAVFPSILVLQSQL